MDFSFCTESFLYMNLKARKWGAKRRELFAWWVRKRIANDIIFGKTALIWHVDLVWTACMHLCGSLGEVRLCIQMRICVCELSSGGQEAAGRARPYLPLTPGETSKQTWTTEASPPSYNQLWTWTTMNCFALQKAHGKECHRLYVCTSQGHMLKP